MHIIWQMKFLKTVDSKMYFSPKYLLIMDYLRHCCGSLVTKVPAFGFDLVLPSCCPCDFQGTSIYSIPVF